ncbi:hypothetical protein [Levilactobacillus brevis]|uniref:hypothetical protein n=1 Tax=Levilactobacillus brevis TaxID=1580 RepID=UPI003512A596
MRQDIKKIRNLLKEYAKLKQEIRTFNQVSSPVLSVAPSHRGGNGVETSLINYVDLSYQLKEVDDALNAIHNPQYQFILHDYIIEKRFTRSEACERLSVSVSKFNYMKNKSIMAFKCYYVGELNRQ